MSQLLQVATRGGGSIVAITGFDPPSFVDQGIPFDEIEGGAIVLATTIAGVISYHYQGLPFTAEGRLAVTNDKPVDYYGSGAAPFDAIGLLALGSGAVDYFSAGIPYTVDGQIAVVAPIPP